ncbi:MAG: flagellar FliJ family protein [Pseudomonadota bacterium]
MKSYRPLIQLAKQKLDEKKTKLADIVRLRESYEQKIQDIDDQIESERAAAANAADDAHSVFIGAAFPEFVDAARGRQKKHRESLEQVERQERLARIEVQGAYQEVRKFELAEEQRIEKERIERERVEQIEMDELALNLHRFTQKQLEND